MWTQQSHCIELVRLFARLIFLRNGFTAYAVLSPVSDSSCHRRLRIKGFAEPG
jgi:hypothetical protein